MIRIDEIYNHIFYPNITKKPFQSMHYFDPFGETSVESLKVLPLTNDRKKSFLIWDQEPFYTEYHKDTINHFHYNFVRPIGLERGDIIDEPICDVNFVTSEKNSSSVNKMCDEFGYEQSYYFFHAWASLDWYRGYNRTELIPNYSHRLINNTFFSPNRTVGGNRTHRIDLFKKIVENNLVNGNKISFPKHCPFSGEEIKIPNIDLPLVFNGEKAGNIPNESYKISLWNEAKDSLLYLVTETLYEQDTLHLTEKTFKPIVMQMPFILVGTKGSLEYLRSYGFKTFDSIWNESYDQLNSNERIDAIIKILKDLNSLSSKEKIQLQKKLAPIVEYNFNWFYSQEFENLLWNELTNMMKEW